MLDCARRFSLTSRLPAITSSRTSDGPPFVIKLRLRNGIDKSSKLFRVTGVLELGEQAANLPRFHLINVC